MHVVVAEVVDKKVNKVLEEDNKEWGGICISNTHILEDEQNVLKQQRGVHLRSLKFIY